MKLLVRKRPGSDANRRVLRELNIDWARNPSSIPAMAIDNKCDGLLNMIDGLSTNRHTKWLDISLAVDVKSFKIVGNAVIMRTVTRVGGIDTEFTFVEIERLDVHWGQRKEYSEFKSWVGTPSACLLVEYSPS